MSQNFSASNSDFSSSWNHHDKNSNQSNVGSTNLVVLIILFRAGVFVKVIKYAFVLTTIIVSSFLSKCQ
jgi:hypothetical protein